MAQERAIDEQRSTITVHVGKSGLLSAAAHDHTINTVRGVLFSATSPENGTVTYTYSSNMPLASQTDARGLNFTYQYDSYDVSV